MSCRLSTQEAIGITVLLVAHELAIRTIAAPMSMRTTAAAAQYGYGV